MQWASSAKGANLVGNPNVRRGMWGRASSLAAFASYDERTRRRQTFLRNFLTLSTLAVKSSLLFPYLKASPVLVTSSLFSYFSLLFSGLTALSCLLTHIFIFHLAPLFPVFRLLDFAVLSFAPGIARGEEEQPALFCSSGLSSSCRTQMVIMELHIN